MTTATPGVVRQSALSIGAFFFKYRNGIFPAIMAFIILCIPPSVQFGSERIDFILTIVGAVMAISGACVRLLVIGFAYIKRGGQDKKVYADTLVIEGLYAHSRNPMYVGNILITVGIGILYGSAAVYLGVIPLFLFIYLCIVTTEENYLAKKFGAQYEHYCKTVPRFFPNMSGFRKTLSSMSYDWRKVIKKDAGTFSATVAGVLLVIMWRDYSLYDFSAVKSELIELGIGLALVAIVFRTLHWLKRSGRLDTPASLSQG